MASPTARLRWSAAVRWPARRGCRMAEPASRGDVAAAAISGCGHFGRRVLKMRNHHVDLMSAAVLAAGLLVAVPDARAATATEKCQAAKVKAAGKKIFEKANCQEKALKKSIAIDQACMQSAEDEFTKAIAKADSIGTCCGTASSIDYDADTS